MMVIPVWFIVLVRDGFGTLILSNGDKFTGNFKTG
jgi:hypothetical protein